MAIFLTGQMNQGDSLEIISFYNTENFFSPNSSVETIEKTRLLQNWDDWKYRNKLQKIARVFQFIEEEQGALPMFIGLCEIQSESVLYDLLYLPPFERKYGFIHINSPDERGIDVAALYDKSKIKILDTESITFFFNELHLPRQNYDATRDVLYVQFQYLEDVYHAFIFHLPSKRERDVNLPKRAHILSKMKSRFEELAKENANIILLGDFNENPDSSMIKDLLEDENGVKLFKNPFEELYKKNQFSTFHYKDGLLFDQILMSEGIFTGSASLRFLEAKVFNSERISSKDKKYSQRPFRTYAGTRYLGGYSDHFPVLAKFNSKRNNKDEKYD